MKKVLSANPAAPMSIESLMEDVDVNAVVKREELEVMIKPYIDRVTVPLEQALADSKDVRQEVYSWLFRTRSKAGQDNRIRILLERDAFVRIGERWRRLGYPFETLTPSYGSAVGASGDRPARVCETG